MQSYILACGFNSYWVTSCFQFLFRFSHSGHIIFPLWPSLSALFVFSMHFYFSSSCSWYNPSILDFRLGAISLLSEGIVPWSCILVAFFFLGSLKNCFIIFWALSILPCFQRLLISVHRSLYSFLFTVSCFLFLCFSSHLPNRSSLLVFFASLTRFTRISSAVVIIVYQFDPIFPVGLFLSLYQLKLLQFFSWVSFLVGFLTSINWETFFFVFLSFKF